MALEYFRVIEDRKGKRLSVAPFDLTIVLIFCDCSHRCCYLFLAIPEQEEARGSNPDLAELSSGGNNNDLSVHVIRQPIG